MADPFDFNNMALPFISSSANLRSFSELEGAAEVPSHLRVLRHWVRGLHSFLEVKPEASVLCNEERLPYWS